MVEKFFPRRRTAAPLASNKTACMEQLSPTFPCIVLLLSMGRFVCKSTHQLCILFIYATPGRCYSFAIAFLHPARPSGTHMVALRRGHNTLCAWPSVISPLPCLHLRRPVDPSIPPQDECAPRTSARPAATSLLAPRRSPPDRQLQLAPSLPPLPTKVGMPWMPADRQGQAHCPHAL